MSDAGDDFDRLYWQCRRGMRELDELLINYLKKHRDMDAREAGSFRLLLACPDTELLEYLMGRQQPADRELSDVVSRIRAAVAD